MRTAADGTTLLTTRNCIDSADELAGLAAVFGQTLDGRPVLDGEVVYNEHGEVDFGLLQERRGRYQRHRSTGAHAHPF